MAVPRKTGRDLSAELGNSNAELGRISSTGGRRAWGLLLIGLALGTSGFSGAGELPELAPQVTGAIPLGAQQGQRVEIRLRGNNLHQITDLSFTHPEIQATVLSSTFYEARVKIAVGSEVPVGLHDYQLRTPRGAHVGVFHVGSLPQESESEPNDDTEQAQEVSTPALIDGVIDQGDYDLFRFRVAAGETVVLDLTATRAASPLDATLALLDPQGQQLDFIDDYHMFKDPQLVLQSPAAGEYLVRVAGSAEKGSPESSYRLMIGAVPLIRRVLPAGARIGGVTELTLYGLNLEKVTTLRLGNSLAHGEILKKHPQRLRFRLTLPSDLQPGQHPLHALTDATEAPLPVPLVISHLQEDLVANAPDRTTPQAVPLPAALTGVLERRKASHFFTFQVEAAQRVAFQADSMKLGYLLDPALILYDDQGQQLAYQDEPAPTSGKQMPSLDPYLEHEFQKAGRYHLMIRDSAQRGFPNYVYRLRIEPVEPNFVLQTLTATHTLFRGRNNLLPVRVRRLGGWDAPVDVWIENPPEGFRVGKTVAEPRNTIYKGTCGEDLAIHGTDVQLQLELAEETPAGHYPLRVRARGQSAGKRVERTADVLYRWGSVGKIMGPTQDQRLLVTVTDLPPVVLETPERFSVTAGKLGRLKVVAMRYLNPEKPLELQPDSLPDGVRLERTVLAPGFTQLEVLLKSSADAEPGTYPMVLRAGGVDSPPIELKIAGEKEN